MRENTDPMILVRTHWRTFLLLWLSPVVLAAGVSISDFFPSFTPPAFLVILATALPLWIGLFFLVRLKRKTDIAFPTLYAAWLVPTMILWVAFVLLRALVLTLLQRPL